jgi:murein DD-endopeptidase MepM/ murein hydrolase activator NlpD
VATAAALVLPSGLAAAATLVNPYTGKIPIVFPLRGGTYLQPVRDNWHASRVDAISPWSHRLSKVRRAHDGVDVFPASSASLPAVYAPFSAVVSAVCVYDGSAPDYRVSTASPPPWNYSGRLDSGLPRFGHFIWLQSTAPDASAGYFMFYCHLQDEPVLRGFLGRVGQEVTAGTQVGVLGDSGNAEGEPQLHLEIHYPLGSSFACTRCKPRASGRTSINPYASLRDATARA